MRTVFIFLIPINANFTGHNSLSTANKVYDEIQERYKQDLHHYFRFLYHIIKFIKYSPIGESEKYKYSSILRATLSAYEIPLIFYNCLHEYGSSHFKPLVEEYSFLKNLDRDLIFSKEHMDEFDPLTFSPSSERKEKYKAWKKKNQKKGDN